MTTYSSIPIFFGPLNDLLDLAWLTGDPQRQAFRDKFADTYVVLARAEPRGLAPLGRRTYPVGGATVTFSQVQVPPAEPAGTARA